MTRLFGVDIAAIVNSEIAPGLRPATLIAVTPTTRTLGALASGTNPTETSYPCRGVRLENRGQLVAGELVGTDEAIVLLVANSIGGGAVTPKATDKVTIEGRTRSIVRLDGDPARASWVCVVR